MIKIDVTILIQFVNFMVLLAVLNYLLYRPLRAMLLQRKENIENSLQKAKDLEGQIEEKMSRYQDQLQEAKLKGSQERAAMRQAASEAEAGILAEAHASAGQQIQQVRERVTAEAMAASEQLKQQTASLAGEIATKVLGRAL